MFVPLAAAAERVSLQDRMQGLLPSHPVQNPAAWKREVQMLLAAHAECLHLAPQFIPAGTPRSAASLWEASEHRETNTARAFCCFTSSGTNLHWVIKCALCRIITSPFRCAWNKSLFLFSFNPKISFQNALGYLKRKKKPKTCFWYLVGKQMYFYGSNCHSPQTFLHLHLQLPEHEEIGEKNLIWIYYVISMAFMEDMLTMDCYACRLTYVSHIMESISHPV